MKSPKFTLREGDLKDVFNSGRLKHTWRHKVRHVLQNDYLLDSIDYLDFHTELDARCNRLERLILSGGYVPQPVRRILVEKSKGLCRQIVVPGVQDALVLQCLSDALYAALKGTAPSPKAFFEPDDHSFSNVRKALYSEPRYGSFRAWLNFQRALFQFAKERNYIVITDIANYYDFISYTHLRNIVSGKISRGESVLDMLIFVLSGFLWQPDYMPRVEIGLPQVNIDAPRILAHTFLYEVDELLSKNPDIDFVRYMDDINIGVDSIKAAKTTLRDLDLILQTRQVRLNSGKTQILSSTSAEKHFRIKENRVIDYFIDILDRKIAAGVPIDREKKRLSRTLKSNYRKKRFDDGNGEKILKRLISLSRKIEATIPISIVKDCLARRPAVRESILKYLSVRGVSPQNVRLVSDFLSSGGIVDDASHLLSAEILVAARASRIEGVRPIILTLADNLAANNSVGMHSSLWLLSKFGEPNDIIGFLKRNKERWMPEPWLGRFVGGLAGMFSGTHVEGVYKEMITSSRNMEAIDVSEFHTRLRTDVSAFTSVKDIIQAPNPSLPLRIRHAKFLILLSILSNRDLRRPLKVRLIENHRTAWSDVFYRRLARRAVIPRDLKSLIR